MKSIFIIILLIPVVYISQKDFIDTRSGVRISFSTNGEIFPEKWYSEKINAKVIPLDTIEYNRSRKVIEQALLKYPIDVLEENLTTTFVFNSMSFFGQQFGGTNSINNVYLSNKGIRNSYTNFYIQQLFHAEFSSILLRNYPDYLDKKAWEELNPENFFYGSGGVNALKKGNSSEKFDHELNKKGFLNEYATSSFENDFNSFAKNIFLPKNNFQKLYEENEVIEKKRKLIIRFYNKLNSLFNELYFNKLFFTTAE